MRFHYYSLLLLTMLFCTDTDAMKRKRTNSNQEDMSEIALPTLPKEIIDLIAVCSPAKNSWRQTCKTFAELLLHTNENLFFHEQLYLNRVDLKKFVLYFADIGKELTVKNLLHLGANPNTSGDHGRSLMYYAIRNKNVETIKLLIDHPLIFNKDLQAGETALDALASQNNPDQTNTQLTDKPNMSTKDKLHFFAEIDDSAMVESLLVDAQPEDTVDLLVRAVAYEAINVIRALLTLGMSPNAADTDYNDYPAHMAARRGYGNILRLLVEYGGDITITDSENNTPLHWAIQSGYINCVQYLLDQGACANTRGGRNNNTSLTMAIKLNYIKVVDVLLSKDIDINAQEVQGDTPLHTAVYCRRPLIVKKLIGYPNIKLNIKNDNGWTPLDIAGIYKHWTVFNILRKRDAKHCHELYNELFH